MLLSLSFPRGSGDILKDGSVGRLADGGREGATFQRRARKVSREPFLDDDDDVARSKRIVFCFASYSPSSLFLF